MQLLLALGVLGEVLRRWLAGSAPEPLPMMSMALLAKNRDGGAHMQASWIFSTSDVLANLGVILAGALEAWTGSNLPDLLIGTLVLNGARRILRLKT